MSVRHPSLSEVASGITAVDTQMVGEPECNAVYVVRAAEPALVECGPGADVPVILEALDLLGLGADDLAHLVVTHIHLDHAGGAGELSRAFPSATVWVHERGAPHLVDPTRLVASTARTYGEDRMRAFFGRTLPVAPERIRAVADGDRIALGERTLDVVHTPGHASHHVALHDDGSGAIFTGEAIGSYLPWADCYRPALPPPETDVEEALASIETIRSRRPSMLLTSHFGAVADADEGCRRGAARVRSWSASVRRLLEADPDVAAESIAEALHAQAVKELHDDSGGMANDLSRYDAIGSIAMNGAGITRYWRTRWERESQGEQG